MVLCLALALMAPSSLSASRIALAATADATTEATTDYPWSDTSKTATGNYIADSYTELTANHVFESVTQERLLDILSSPGNFYIVFGGPARVSSQTALPLINEQALADNVTKIYHFDPLIDGYQADITKANTPYRVSSSMSINQLWARVAALLPSDEPIASYDSSDTLLFLYNRNETDPGTPGIIRASYRLTTTGITDLNPTEEKAKIAQVFRGVSGLTTQSAEATTLRNADDTQADDSNGQTTSDVQADDSNGQTTSDVQADDSNGQTTSDAQADDVQAISDVQATDNNRQDAPGAGHLTALEAPVILATVRTDLQFFNRVYNAAATRIEGSTASANRVGTPVTLFDGLTETTFKLHQINFTELLNLYNTPGEHIIFYGATWCHNTQAIIGTIAAEAAKTPGVTTVYVYDTTLGNQVTFGTGTDINTATTTSSTFNSRNAGSANFTVGYLYAEAARPLGNFITENNSYQSNSIAYYPNGDLSAALTSIRPWETGDGYKSAIRLQLPFLIAYDNSQSEPVTRQWLHKQTEPATDGRDLYLEYMLELAWVRATPLAAADTSVYRNGAVSDTGQNKVAIAAEAVANVTALFSGIPLPVIKVETPNGSSHTLDTQQDLIFSVQRDFALYDAAAGITLDGVALPTSAYEVKDNNTRVTIFASYLETLKEGSHTLSVPFIDGLSVETPFLVAAAPTKNDDEESKGADDNTNANPGNTNANTTTATNNNYTTYSTATYLPAANSSNSTNDPESTNKTSTAATTNNATNTATPTTELAPVAIDDSSTPLAATTTPASDSATSDEGTIPVQVLIAIIAVLLVAFGAVALKLGLFSSFNKRTAGRGPTDGGPTNGGRN
jgi:hypothetical protein